MLADADVGNLVGTKAVTGVMSVQIHRALLNNIGKAALI